MNTFYLVFRVIPTSPNKYVNEIEGAFAYCWLCDDDPASATNLASFKVRQLHWKVVSIEQPPVLVTEKDCSQNEIDLERFRHAQAQRVAIAFEAWSKDGKTFTEPIKLEVAKEFILGDYLSDVAGLKRTGKCLHFDAGTTCTEPIEAHSIQKNGALSLIAQKGQVYVPSQNFSDIKRSLGQVVFAKRGINAVSTFRGFCGKHDNEIFQSIDDQPLLAPSSEQITLYAYRALCRELFVKENSVRLFQDYAKNHSANEANRHIFDAVLKGASFALQNLAAQKEKYDAMFTSKLFVDTKSCLFHSSEPPSVVFSGALFPEYDFRGNKLQDLSHHDHELHLITFSFAPMCKGWGLLFAWHSDSSGSCVPLMRSLATRGFEDGSYGDLLLRFVVANCENLAISPVWWESLNEYQRAEITKCANNMVNPFSLLQADYLEAGLESANWKFDSVIPNYE